MIRLKRAARWILLGVFVLSLPLCCLPILSFFPFMFGGRFQVVNQSGQTVYVTPMGTSYGQRQVLVKSFSRFPYLPFFKAGDLRLEPGQALRILCEVDEDLIFSEIVVRNRSGEYRQVPIQEDTDMLMPALPETSYVIGAWEELAPISASALETARQARRLNLAAWGVLALGLLPLGLLLAWRGLGRSQT